MEFIEGFPEFIKCEAASKNGVNPLTIKSITEDNILTGLVAYATVVSARQIGPEILGLEIHDDIPIPKVIRTNQKKGFIS